MVRIYDLRHTSGADTPESKMKFAKAIKKFLDYCTVERQLSGNTLQAYAYDLADFGKWLPAQTQLPVISTETLRAYLEDMVGDRKLSPSTVRRRLACLRAFFRFFEDDGLATNPFSGWRLKLPHRKRLPRTLSRDETSSLLAPTTPTTSQTKSGLKRVPCVEIRLMISTGIRVGEMCTLQTGDVSQDGSTLRIRGKGSKDRIVYVTDAELRGELQKLVSLRQYSPNHTGPLFVNRFGAKMRPHSFRSKLRSIAGEAGLKRRVTPHMLRHTAATLLIESGVDIRIVQRLLGHSSIATTEIYTHVSDEALRSSLERANVLGVFAQ